MKVTFDPDFDSSSWPGPGGSLVMYNSVLSGMTKYGEEFG